jgi:arylsulfatase A-like enzyme
MKARIGIYSLVIAAACGTAHARGKARNVVIFVADGLRPSSVNPTDAPTLARLQKEGVFFVNSHSLYPTVTTANASAIATGHLLGDTGDFANALYTGAQTLGSGTPFVEDDQVLASLDEQLGGNYIGEATLLATARAHGFSTASIGKVGPTLIQDLTQGNHGAGVPTTILIDDRTGSDKGVPLDPAIAEKLKTALGSAAPPSRAIGKPKTPDDNAFSGDTRTPGTRVANVPQQRYLADAVTKVILPELKKRGKPFVLLFWSRDPDATQHNQGDSLGSLVPGINGPTSTSAVKNADDTLGRIWGAIEGDPELATTTDLFVTSDHGFSTASRREIDAEGHASTSPTTKRQAPDVRPGDLPPGFVALDIAAHLGMQLCDPDRRFIGVGGVEMYATVEADAHPIAGNGLVDSSCAMKAPGEAKVIVAANGGSDLIYMPDGDAKRIADVATFLLAQDYVGAVFVDAARPPAGTLNLRDINLKGTARTPTPSIVVALKSFSRDPNDPVRTQIDVSDNTLQQGQGMHGSFGRADVTNTMIGFGPDFKRGLVDRAPASNADIPLTLARILGLTLPSRGRLRGRALSEALVGGPATTPSTCGELAARPTPKGLRTAIHFQTASGVRYLDAAKLFAGPVSWDPWVDELPCGRPKAPSATRP